MVHVNIFADAIQVRCEAADSCPSLLSVVQARQAHTYSSLANIFIGKIESIHNFTKPTEARRKYSTWPLYITKEYRLTHDQYISR
jgi:hypothetical protein